MIGLIVLPRQAYESEKGWVNRSGRDVYILPSSRVREGSSGPYRAYVSGDIHEGDMIEIQGSTYQVEGEPAEFMRGARMAGVRITTARIGRSR